MSLPRPLPDNTARRGSDRGRAYAAVVAAAALAVIALAWFSSLTAVAIERREATARLEAELAREVTLFAGDLRRELLVVDQSLRSIRREWEADPAGVDLRDWRERVQALSDASPQF